jgi:hypothetical protein
MAMGRATPIGYHHAAYLSHSHTKARTQGDSRRAIAFLTEWCGEAGTQATLEAITRKEALRFHRPANAARRSTVTRHAQQVPWPPIGLLAVAEA